MKEEMNLSSCTECCYLAYFFEPPNNSMDGVELLSLNQPQNLNETRRILPIESLFKTTHLDYFSLVDLNLDSMAFHIKVFTMLSEPE